MSTEPAAAFAPSSQPPAPLPLASPQQRQKIETSAKAFESQLISMMLQPMFEGLSTDGLFGGGQAEGTYRSFMLDAFGKQMAKAGGLGIAAPVVREMLKMQGLR